METLKLCILGRERGTFIVPQTLQRPTPVYSNVILLNINVM